MTKVRLTERRIRDAKHDPAAIKFLWDVGLPAFGVRFSKGDTRAFVLWTRNGSKKSLLTLGRVGEMTLDAARAMASAELDQIERGGADLTARRADAKAGKTVAQGCAWFLDTHVPRRIGLGKMSPRTAVDYRQMISLYILPRLGYLKIAAVKRADVERMLDAVGAGKMVQFARVRSLTRSMFNVFRKEGWSPQENPAKFITVSTERPRTRVLAAGEQAAFLGALARQGECPATLAIRLLYETGGRLGEVRTLKWEYVDADARLLRLPESKTGPKVITLTPEALEVIARCKKIHGNSYVFPGGRGGDEPVGSKPVRGKFHAARVAAGLEDVRVHDLRRTMIVDALSANVPITIVARLVGHSSISMTARYARHAVGQVHEGAEQMAAARRAKRGADVLPLVKRRA